MIAGPALQRLLQKRLKVPRLDRLLHLRVRRLDKTIPPKGQPILLPTPPTPTADACPVPRGQGLADRVIHQRPDACPIRRVRVLADRVIYTVDACPVPRGPALAALAGLAPRQRGDSLGLQVLARDRGHDNLGPRGPARVVAVEPRGASLAAPGSPGGTGAGGDAGTGAALPWPHRVVPVARVPAETQARARALPWPHRVVPVARVPAEAQARARGLPWQHQVVPVARALAEALAREHRLVRPVRPVEREPELFRAVTEGRVRDRRPVPTSYRPCS